MVDIANILFDNFGKTVALIALITLAIIAIFKVNIKFDLNDFLKARKSKHTNAAKHYCPHMDFQSRDNGAMQIGWFESPPGTHVWICKNCQRVVNNIDDDEQKKAGEYYLNNPKKYKKAIKKYNYHAKKSI